MKIKSVKLKKDLPGVKAGTEGKKSDDGGFDFKANETDADDVLKSYYYTIELMKSDSNFFEIVYEPEAPPGRRLEIYSKMREVISKGSVKYTFCPALNSFSTLDIEDLPELMEYKPAGLFGGGYWFNPQDTQTRLDILDEIISKMSPKPIIWTDEDMKDFAQYYYKTYYSGLPVSQALEYFKLNVYMKNNQGKNLI